MNEANTILSALLTHGMAVGDALAREARKWDGPKPLVDDKGRVSCTKAQAQPLVDAGLLEYQSSGSVGWLLTHAGIAAAAKLVPVERLDLTAVIADCLSLPYFRPNDDGLVPIPYLWEKGDADTKMVLVLGENAGGKSFFRRIVRSITDGGHPGNFGTAKRDPGPYPVREMIHLSMEQRAGGGMASSMVYGSEQWCSTGDNSARTVTTGIKTALGRSHRNLIYWDEPDIGMSAGSAAGAGVSIREFADNPGPLVQAVFVTSHSPAMVHQLGQCKAKPHYLYLGNDKGPSTLAEWYKHQLAPPPISPAELAEKGNQRHTLIQQILNRSKRKGKK